MKKSRLQFRHSDIIFHSRDAAYNYLNQIVNSSNGEAFSLDESLVGEPIVIRYIDDENENRVNLILAIGTSGETGDGVLEPYQIIDTTYLNRNIDDLYSALNELSGVNEQISALTESVSDLMGTVVTDVVINGVSGDVNNNTAELTLTTDDIKFPEDYQEGLVPSGSSVTDLANAIQNALVELGNDVDGIHIEKVESGLPETVKERYILVNADGEQLGENIDIYKDSSLYDVYLGHIDDELESEDSPVVIDGDGHEALCFIYLLSNGKYDLVKVDLDDFLTEYEFNMGLTVKNHVVSVKISGGDEGYLHFSPVDKGLKVTGIDNAIALAISPLETDIATLSGAVNTLSAANATYVARINALEAGLSALTLRFEAFINGLTGTDNEILVDKSDESHVRIGFTDDSIFDANGESDSLPQPNTEP